MEAHSIGGIASNSSSTLSNAVPTINGYRSTLTKAHAYSWNAPTGWSDKAPRKMFQGTYSVFKTQCNKKLGQYSKNGLNASVDKALLRLIRYLRVKLNIMFREKFDMKIHIMGRRKWFKQYKYDELNIYRWRKQRPISCG